MLEEDIVLWHLVSREGLEVDKAQYFTIESLPLSNNMKRVRSFIGHAGFYRQFIKDFSIKARPLYKILEKDVSFMFDEACLHAFVKIKKRLISAPIMTIPDWSLPFEIMCYTSDYTIRAFLGQ